MQPTLIGADQAAAGGVTLPWHRAATLTERLQRGSPAHTDPERAGRRLAMWLEIAPLAGEPESLDARLEPLGITAAQLTALLGESDESLAGRFPDEPKWHRTFTRWWADGSVDAPDRSVGPELGLLEVARPLIEGAVRELGRLVRGRLACAGPEPLFGDHDHLALAFNATFPFADILNHLQRMLVLELNVARLEGRLAGDDPVRRFDSFVQLLRDPDVAWTIWDEYPVLARLIVRKLEFWVQTRLELLDALMNDLPLMVESVLTARPTRLERVEFGAGDTHREGRSVAILTFDNGQVVFKPRSLAMDVAFDALMGWLNDRGLRHQLWRPRVLDRGTHGWAEFVDAGAVTDAAGADRYAWRLGALTAMLYTLHATDVHHENILACGEHPVLVDLEALAHTDKTAAVAKVDGVRDIAAVTLANSVQSVGVLPNRMLVRADDGTFGLDVSALGGDSGQLTPMAVPAWEDAGTDTMHLVARRTELDPVRNHPLGPDGIPFDLVDRSDHFMAGFADAYRRLQEHSGQGGPGGVLDRLAATRSRYIARPTHIYGRLLLESTHPDFARDAIDRERSLARLCAGHDGLECRAAMVRAEVADLLQGDIPMFTVDVDSGALRGAAGQQIGQRTPPLRELATRVRQLGDADREFQEWVIRSSVAATTMAGADARWPNWRRSRLDGPADAGAVAEESLRVARRLADLALRDQDSVGWAGLCLVDESFWQLTAAPVDLYVGTSGIGHALDAVGAVTGDGAVQELALTVLEQVARRSRLIAASFNETAPKKGGRQVPIGAFNSLGGGMYTLAHAAVRHRRHDFLDAAELLLPSMTALARDDVLLDVVSGSAGAILAALALERARPGGGALDLARACGRRLLEVRVELESGWGWPTPGNPQPLLGFSHGTSGIAVAFARLHAVSPRPEYAEAIRHALRREAGAYDADLRNWPDLRPENISGRTVMNAWCHGAPGIALARQELLASEAVPELRADLDEERRRAVLATISTGLDQDPVYGIGNHSLCHGDVGNLLILDQTVSPDTEPSVADLLPAVWRTLIEEGRENGWLCGVPHGVETPGLMTGVAGVAWGLARKADPARVPNVMSLEPPAGSLGDDAS